MGAGSLRDAEREREEVPPIFHGRLRSHIVTPRETCGLLSTDTTREELT